MEEYVPLLNKKKKKKKVREELGANEEGTKPESKSKKRKEKEPKDTTSVNYLEDYIPLSSEKKRKNIITDSCNPSYSAEKKSSTDEDISKDDDSEPKSKKKKSKKTSTNSEDTDHEEDSEKRVHFHLKEDSTANETADELKNFLEFGVNAFIDTEKSVAKRLKNSEARRKRIKKKLRKRELKLANASDTEEAADCSKSIREHPLSEAPDAVAERKKIKHEKHLQREKTEEDLKSKKALQYLETYKNDRSSWKFNKNTSVFLMKYYLDSQRVPDSHFPIVLEYFRSAKGNSMTNIKDIAVKALALKNDEAMNTQRAQQVVSLFD